MRNTIAYIGVQFTLMHNRVYFKFLQIKQNVLSLWSQVNHLYNKTYTKHIIESKTILIELNEINKTEMLMAISLLHDNRWPCYRPCNVARNLH